MIKAFLFIVFAVSSSAAFAHPSTTQMMCGQAKGIVRQYRAVVLNTGSDTYDRFVISQFYCASGDRVRDAFVPTLDVRSCHIGYTCHIDDGI
jgi:hypothetical protein